MTDELLSLAAGVVQQSSREHPADSVLRQTLRRAALHPGDSQWVARAVFAFYRWHGWLDLKKTLRDQIEQGLRLATRSIESPASFPDADLVEKSVPAWVAECCEVTPAWARVLQSEPRLWLRARVGQGRALADALGNSRWVGPGPLAEAVEYLGEKDLFWSPEFQEGKLELQDIHSQAVSVICAPKAGETWWDGCAGEGGKTLHLSDLMQNRGLIWASDRANWRLQRLRRRAGRAKVYNYRVALWNGGPRLPTKTKFDGVLLDAPCSGTGTWQRNPHARWTTTRDDVVELSRLQIEMLGHAAVAVKSGGKLVYAVCTLTRAETTGVVEEFMRAHPEFDPMPFEDPTGINQPLASQLVLWPQNSGGNGMFVAAWVRSG